MKYARHVTLGATAVIGLLFLAGTGCGPKNEGEKVALQFMQQREAEAQRKYETLQAKLSCYKGIDPGLSALEKMKAERSCDAQYQN